MQEAAHDMRGMQAGPARVGRPRMPKKAEGTER